MKKRIELNQEERITLQTLIIKQIRKNKEYEEAGIKPCFEEEDLKKLYKKIAGYEFEER